MKSVQGAEVGTDHYSVIIELQQRIAVERPRGKGSGKEISIEAGKLRDREKAHEYSIKL